MMVVTTFLACAALLVPMPPVVRFADHALPGDQPWMVATDPVTLTIYHAQPLDPFERAHEIAHLLDAEMLTSGDRVFFTRLLGLTGPWQQQKGEFVRPRSPDEWFADYYAATAIGMRLDGSTRLYDVYADFGPRRLRRFALALDRFGRRYGLRAYRIPGHSQSTPTKPAPKRCSNASSM